MEYFGESIGTVVVDPGSAFFKGGFAGDSSPSSYFPSVVAKSKSEKFSFGNDVDYVLGKESKVDVSSPLLEFKKDENNSKDVVSLLSHCTEKRLKISQKEHPLLLAEPVCWTEKGRENIVKDIFEKTEFDAIFLAKQPVLSCFASGRYSGFVLDVGASGSVCSPVSDGYVLPQQTKFSKVGGDFIEDKLKESLLLKKVSLLPHSNENSTASARNYIGRNILRNIKEQLGSIQEEDKYKTKEKNKFKLPDGRVIEITSQHKKIPAESLFNNGADKSNKSLSQILVDTLLDTDADLRKLLIGNVILSGRGFLFKGVYQRLYSEVSRILPPALSKLKIIMPCDNIRSNFEVVWLGGSILGSLGTFKQLLLTRQDYEESGVSIVGEKCP